MSQLHKPGKYPARIVDFGIWKGQKGPSATIMFEYLDENKNPQTLTWFGSFNGGAREFTVETLIRCGFTGSNGAELNKGKGSGVLDEKKEFEIVVANEPNPSKNNALQSKIKFVNLPGGSAFREKMADSEASVLMGGLNLAADFLQARQKVASGPATPAVAAPLAAEEDIPF